MSSRKTTKRVTMMDVAKAAGCSQATVSIVLNSVTDIKIFFQTYSYAGN